MAGVCVEWVEWGPPSTMEARNFDGLSCSLGAHEQAAQPGIVPVRPSPTIAHGMMGGRKSTVHPVSEMCRLGSSSLGSGLGLVARCSEQEMPFYCMMERHAGGNYQQPR
jgi:hypothetical protein